MLLVSRTYRGNSDGARCHYPFFYQGKEYYHCLPWKDGLEWCSTTDDFDRDGKFGLCTSECEYKISTTLLNLSKIALYYL